MSEVPAASTTVPVSPVEYGRSKRKTVPAKRITDSLSGCLCEQVLGCTNDDVIECKAKGCETQWYHLECMNLEYAPQKWACETCESLGRSKRTRR
ncbi:hypothetical protein HYPSUDRAFT_146835 [Hypholoma sublateritium FD-334 SS-4]|uniref:Zinc finger PHD-type domain-containing protein n=1 Tax=Hypholoma sublateritium (strain FD-334 SS-4) TaxID=945553 RepID=A0A0D2KR78_HYPSF|nr:hypothetical protein HYPSUDRAFT_146835 [Hypholoma sublateritium FD-334 SS-4]